MTVRHCQVNFSSGLDTWKLYLGNQSWTFWTTFWEMFNLGEVSAEFHHSKHSIFPQCTVTTENWNVKNHFTNQMWSSSTIFNVISGNWVVETGNVLTSICFTSGCLNRFMFVSVKDKQILFPKWSEWNLGVKHNFHHYETGVCSLYETKICS